MTSKHRNTVTTALAVAITAALVAAPAAYSAGLKGRTAAAPAVAPAKAGAQASSHDEFIVSFHAGARASADFGRSLDTAGRSLGVRIAAGDTLGTGARMIQTDRALDEEGFKALRTELLKDPSVRAVDFNGRVFRAAPPNDPRYAEQWHYKAGGINAEAAWDAGATGGGVTVGVIDTGGIVHADLPAITGGYDFITSPTIGNDGDGRDANPADPGDWEPGYDSSWHGSHVQGTIAARTNNALGVAGVARAASVEHLRVLGVGGGTFQDITDAIIWGSGGTVTGVTTRAQPLKILNLSLGGSGACPTVLQDAINAANTRGTIIVVAAGNSNADVANFTPANCNGVVTVAGTGPNNTRYARTNMGEEIEVAAPGGSGILPETNQVLSTVNSGTTVPVASPGGDAYAWYAGTSMAAPHVSATIALMLQADPTLTREEVVRILRATGYATNGYVTGCSTTAQWCSYLIDASDAVAVAAGTMVEPPEAPAGPPPPPPPPPQTVLENGVPVTLGAMALNAEKFFEITVPANATTLTFQLAAPAGGSGDSDLYTRRSFLPNDAEWECRPWTSNYVAETCTYSASTTLGAPIAGKYYVRIDAYSASTGYTLTATHNGTGTPPGTPPAGLAAGSTFSLKGGRHRVVLNWTGGGTNVDIKFNGTTAATVANKQYLAHTFERTGSGNVTYQVCNAGTTTCTSTITVPYAPPR